MLGQHYAAGLTSWVMRLLTLILVGPNSHSPALSTCGHWKGVFSKVFFSEMEPTVMVCPLLRKWELLGVLHILPPLFPSVPWNDGTPHPMTGPQPEATTLCSLLLEPSFSSRSRWTNVSPSHGASVSSVSEVFIAFGQRPAARCIRLLVQSSELEGISELGSSCIAEVVLTRTRKLRSGAPLPRGSWCIMSSLQS